MIDVDQGEDEQGMRVGTVVNKKTGETRVVVFLGPVTVHMSPAGANRLGDALKAEAAYATVTAPKETAT